MKRYDRILTKLNDLSLMNYQVEKTYAKAVKDVTDERMKTFFKEKGAERKQFDALLQVEIKKLESKVDNALMINRRNHLVKMNIKNLMDFENERELLNAVYKITELSIEKYNELLMEMHMSLSLCKLLIKQRDHMQSSLHLIRRQEAVLS